MRGKKLSKLEIRKMVIEIDETHRDFNKQLKKPTIKAVSAAVIKNFYANKYIEDLEPLYDIGAEIGGFLAEKCVSTLKVKPEEIESYGKGAIIGIDGEIEHAAAILHPRFGSPVRVTNSLINHCCLGLDCFGVYLVGLRTISVVLRLGLIATSPRPSIFKSFTTRFFFFLLSAPQE